MKNWILWSFSRGSFQYDVLCALILLTIFAIPREVFNDRPGYMRLPEAGRVGLWVDDDQNEVYTVKVSRSGGETRAGLERQALGELGRFLGLEAPPETFRVEPISNALGSVVAFAFWVK
jgi:hypothetical protein